MEYTNPLQDEKNRYLDSIAEVIANIPDVSPPEALLESVMAGVQPKRMGVFRRLWRALHTPMASITVTPLRLASLGASVVVFIIITWAVMIDIPRDHKIDMAMEIKGETKVPVVFALDMPDVSRVDVIGSFNGWSPADYHMQWDPKRRLWFLMVHLREGTHEYAYLVNGKTILPDPGALVYREDGFGNRNSVLIINRDKNNGNHI